MIRNSNRIGFRVSFTVSIIFLAVYALLSQSQDSKRVTVGNVSDTLHSDTTKIIEDAALDIAQNRGFFIYTRDGKMQLRILGSVRLLTVFDYKNLETKNHLTVLEIPVGEENVIFPNVFFGLGQTYIRPPM